MTATALGATPRTPAQHDRRDRIVQAATELLGEHDYDRILVRDVAERAGVALDTLYRYFPSKEHLYVQVLWEWGAAYDGAARRAAEGAKATDADRLAAALRVAVRAYERRPTFYRLLTVLEAATDPAIAARYQEFAERFQHVLLGAFRHTADDDARVISLAARALMGSLLSSWSHRAIPLTHVYADLDRFVALVLGPTGRPAGRTRRGG